MALFGKLGKSEKTKEVKSETKKIAKTADVKEEGKAVVKSEAHAHNLTLLEIIQRPRITEKATMLSEQGAYVFEVHKRATKSTVRQAISKRFGVTVTKVRMIPVPDKRRTSRSSGKKTLVSGGVKAVVFVKKGEKIEFV